MDNYCPWLNNCIGYFNHKHFILFLFYTVCATNLMDISLLLTLHSGGFSAGTTFMLWEGAFLSTLLSGLVTPFFGFHLWLMTNNMTTIEYCETMRSRGKGFKSMYDIGLLGNIKS